MRQGLRISAAIAAAIAGLAAATAHAQGVSAGYEGIARDSFAAWSYTSGAVTIKGTLRTTSVQALYTHPAPMNGNPTPVSYSLHPVTFDCAAKTAAFAAGANYSKSGVLIAPGFASAAAPWTDFTDGFQTLAQTVCTTNF